MDLQFNKGRVLEETYWSAFVEFEPLQVTIELILYNDQKGNKTTQLNWFDQIKEHYLSNENLLFNFINKEIKHLFLEKKEYYSKRNLSLDSISISKTFEKNLDWEIDFCLDNEIEHFVIEMMAWQPVYFSVWA